MDYHTLEPVYHEQIRQRLLHALLGDQVDSEDVYVDAKAKHVIDAAMAWHHKEVLQREHVWQFAGKENDAVMPGVYQTMLVFACECGVMKRVRGITEPTKPRKAGDTDVQA